MTSQDAYRCLEARFKRLAALGEAQGLLQWDMRTMMPPGGALDRGEQLAALAGERHRLLVAEEVGEWIAAAREEAGLDTWQQANLREMERRWRHATALDEDLVEALTRAASACEAAWRIARRDDDFPSLVPVAEDLLGLVRAEAQCKADALGLDPYDALLDGYEPGLRVGAFEPLFDELADFLPPLLERVLARQAERQPAPAPEGPFPAAAQEALGRRLMAAVGFDFDHGRLDTTLHPFCSGTPGDVRIATRYDESDFTSALMGVLHETGHALYDLGLPRAWRWQPVGGALGMVIHESQSLLIEMQCCRSRAFLGFAAPLMAEAFGDNGEAWSADALHRRQIHVSRGLIRVDADEVTYPLHVIARYRLERAMVAGDLALADLPGAWNDTMERLIGVRPQSDRDGCLQDIHWYDGAWGYFPTYTLGALAAAQMFNAAVEAVPAIPDALARGDFAPIRGWLLENVHSKGSLMTSNELIAAATGTPLSASAFRRHLEARYLGGA